MTDRLKKSIVRIKKKNGAIVGTGFLAGDGMILTCAHVIKDALGIRKAQTDTPESDIHLDFAFAPDRKPLTARVVFWNPTVEDGGYDIAGLELKGYPPPASRPAPLDFETTSFEPLRGINYKAYGLPEKYSKGVWSAGKVIEEIPDGFVQLENEKFKGKPIEGGFSGSAVWDEQSRNVIGIVRTACKPDAIAFMIPLYKALELWPELKSTPRITPPPPPIKRIITGFCLALIILFGGLYFSGLFHFHNNQTDNRLKSATSFLNQGMYIQALEQYGQALQICENCPQALPGKSKAEFFREIAETEYNPGEMIERLKHISGIPEDDPHISLLLGNMYAQAGEQKKAESYYSKGHGKRTGPGRCLVQPGRIVSRTGKQRRRPGNVSKSRANCRTQFQIP